MIVALLLLIALILLFGAAVVRGWLARGARWVLGTLLVLFALYVLSETFPGTSLLVIASVVVGGSLVLLLALMGMLQWRINNQRERALAKIEADRAIRLAEEKAWSKRAMRSK